MAKIHDILGLEEFEVREVSRWPQVAKRVQNLTENDRYLKAADFSWMPDDMTEKTTFYLLSRIPLAKKLQKAIINVWKQFYKS